MNEFYRRGHDFFLMCITMLFFNPLNVYFHLSVWQSERKNGKETENLYYGLIGYLKNS